jgi:monofunctional biosynthetic peptidoglycan transglycosylase
VSELFIARRLEAELTKARILEIYLNVIEWGDGIWGAEAAAGTYFGVSASALTLEQSALLAGAIFNPLELNPGKPSKRLVQRQQMILRRMGEVTPPQGPSTMK